MANPNRKAFRHERVNRLVELIRNREMALCAAEYDAATLLIQAAFDDIKCPVPTTFAARAEARRPPWVRVIEKVLREIGNGAFPFPYRFDKEGLFDVLFIRTSHIMEHLEQCDRLREFWDELPIKSDRALKKQLFAAGVLLIDAAGQPRVFERTDNSKTRPRAPRTGHMVGISLPELWRYGLDQLAADQAASSRSWL